MPATRSLHSWLARPRALFDLPVLVALGFMLAACGTDKPKAPGHPFLPPKFDAGSDASSDTNCDGEDVGTVDTRTRYQAGSVPAGQECVEEEQERTCGDDGTWSDWSGTYKVVACEVEDTSCEDGATETRVRWDGVLTQTDAGLEGECLSETQTRTCANNVWGDWSGSYGFETCPITFDQCDGKDHGTTETRERYAAATVDPGQTCDKKTQSRTCDDGTWSDWSPAGYEVEACEVLQYAKCDGELHGKVQTRKRCQAKVGAQGGSCLCEDETRECNDGDWTDWDSEYNYQFDYCDEFGHRRCETEGVLDGQTHTVVRFATAEVEFDQTCQSQNRVGTCKDGTVVDYSGTYTFVSCAKKAPVGCAGGYEHLQKKPRDRYQAATVPYGTLCVKQVQESQCYNGVFGDWTPNTYQFETCSVLPPASCDGTPDGQQGPARVRYLAESVPVGQTCSSQEQRRTCHNGTWSEWDGSPSTYKYETCRVRKRDCTDGGTKVLDGAYSTNTRVRYQSAFPSDSCISQTQKRLCNDGTLEDWTPKNYTLLACSPLPAKKTNISSCRWVENSTPHCIEYPGAIGSLPEQNCDATSGGVWDEERGCPTQDAFAKCKRTVLLNETEYYYVEEDASVCPFPFEWTEF